MDILINRTIEEFLRASYGEGLVSALADELAASGAFEGPRARDYGMTMLEGASRRLMKSTSEMLEDLGAWMTRIEPIRRLLRFSGRDFGDFVQRLDEMPGRAHLVLPKLALPALRIEAQDRSVWVHMTPPDPVWQHLLVGIIRGIADDYGSLCLISGEGARVRVDIWDASFAEGRDFSLHVPVAETRP